MALWQQGLLAASRGQVETARQHALDAVERGKDWRWPSLVTLGQWVLGFLALSLNEPTEASDALAGVPERLERLGIGEPGLWPILPDAVEAAVAVGRLDEAEATVATLEAQARALEHRWATPAARRCRGLLLLAQGDSAAALAAAEDAASGFEAAGFPLDRGRALLVAGEALRRLGERRRAAEKLETAKGVFSELGAPLWLARVEKELRRASPRPRRDGELTSAERGVASLVAEGRTNREVAAQLFTTVGTVEVHLTRIYRKLGVRSRTELARSVADRRSTSWTSSKLSGFPRRAASDPSVRSPYGSWHRKDVPGRALRAAVGRADRRGDLVPLSRRRCSARGARRRAPVASLLRGHR